MGLQWIQPERRVVVSDSLVSLAELQVDESAAVQGIRVFRSEAERFIAVGQGRLEVAGESPSKAPGVPASTQLLIPCVTTHDCPRRP